MFHNLYAPTLALNHSLNLPLITTLPLPKQLGMQMSHKIFCIWLDRSFRKKERWPFTIIPPQHQHLNTVIHSIVAQAAEEADRGAFERTAQTLVRVFFVSRPFLDCLFKFSSA